MDNEKDKQEYLFLLKKLVDSSDASNKEFLRRLVVIENKQKDMGDKVDGIYIDLEIIKRTGGMPTDETSLRKERMKDGATGGGIGAIIVAVVVAIYEWLSKMGKV